MKSVGRGFLEILEIVEKLDKRVEAPAETHVGVLIRHNQDMSGCEHRMLVVWEDPFHLEEAPAGAGQVNKETNIVATKLGYKVNRDGMDIPRRMAGRFDVEFQRTVWETFNAKGGQFLDDDDPLSDFVNGDMIQLGLRLKRRARLQHYAALSEGGGEVMGFLTFSLS